MAGRKLSAHNAGDDKKTHKMNIHSAELLAAASYMTDIIPNGCLYHSWRVGLVSAKIASSLAPGEERDIFLAVLLADVGTVGAIKHITQYPSLKKQIEDSHISTHPRRSAALMDWLPGMGEAAKIVRSHHEWWDGRGYADGKIGNEIPLGSQILRVVVTAVTAGCFSSGANMIEGIRRLAIFTGHTWSKDIWAAFVRSIEDADFYKLLMDPAELSGLIYERLTTLGLPKGLDSEDGIERIFHVFAASVDAKDPSTAGHSLRVARSSKALAQHMNLSDAEVRIAYHAGLAHDCGRLGIPSSILKRSGRLNEEEMNLVRKHAQMTIRILSCIPKCPDMAVLGEIAGHDHERYDGTGYPDRLSGGSIHIISRLLSVCDAFDAMTSSKSYKHVLSPRFAVIRLQQAAGTQFDPAIVEAMTSAVEAGIFEEEHSAAA